MKLTKRTTSIDDLPPEMISELFEYLHLKDLAACSMVNKRWHSVYAAFKLHRLAAIDCHPNYPDYELSKWWYDSNRPIHETDRCSPAMFVRLAGKPLLSNLRQLALLPVSRFKFDLNDLNRFSRLEHLEIDIYFFGEGLHLNLPRLKVLAFHYNNVQCALSIDCPELSTLLYPGEDVDLLEVKHPETIRKLNTDLLGPKLARFKGVESLVTEDFKAINKATLLSLQRDHLDCASNGCLRRTVHHIRPNEANVERVPGRG